MTTAEEREVTADLGEKIAHILLTDWVGERTLFRPTHLGDKWPVTDCYVELKHVRKITPYFFVQVKSDES